MFEEDATSEMLVDMEETVLGSLYVLWVTNPCWRMVSTWKRISKILNHLAMGAMMRPKRVLVMKRWWLTA